MLYYEVHYFVCDVLW